MKQLARIIILFLRFAARARLLAPWIYKLTLRVQPPDRSLRVQGYIFGKVALRQLRKHGRIIPANYATRPRPVRDALAVVAELLGRLRFAWRRNTMRLARWAVAVLPVGGAGRKRLGSRLDRADAQSTAREVASARKVASLAALLSKRTGERYGGVDSLMSAVRSDGALTVCLEPGADMPWALLERLPRGCDLRVLSMSELPDFARLARMFASARQDSVRDRFNDISVKGEALFRAADDLAIRLRETLLRPMADRPAVLPADLEEPVDAALSDRISHALSLYACMQAALQDVEEPILIVGASSGYVHTMPAHILSGLSPVRTWIVAQADDDRMLSEIAERLDAGPAASRLSPATPRLSQDDLSGDAALVLAEQMEALRDLGARRSEAFVEDFATFMAASPFVLILSAVGAPAYVKSFTELGRAALRRFNDDTFPVPVHIDMTQRMPALSSLRETSLDDGGVSLDMSAVLATVQDARLDADDVVRAIDPATLPERGPLDIAMPELLRFLERPLKGWLSYQVPQMMVLGAFGERMAGCENMAAALISTTRNWHGRAVAAGLLRGNTELPVIDMQTLNQLAHPKYRPAMATHMSALSEGQAEIASDYLGMARDRVVVTGALQDEALVRAVAETDRRAAYRSLRVPAGARVITLVSQLQPMPTRMLPFADAIADYLEDDPRAHLLIRLHPRETGSREEQYRALFEARGLLDRISLSRSEDLEAVLAVSDVCTTIYSNVAREAAAVGLPVVLAGFLGWEPPLRLDREGFGSWADSVEAFHAQLRDGLDAHRSANDRGDAEAGDSPSARLLDFVMDAADAHMGGQPTQQFQAHPALEGYADATLIAARGVPLATLPPLFGRYHAVSAYHPGEGVPVGYLPPRTRFKTGRIDLEDEGMFEDATAKANALSERLVDTLLDVFPSTTRIGQSLADMRYGLWLRLRPPLIDRFFQHDLMLRGISAARGALVIAAPNAAELRDLVGHALSAGQTPREDIFVLDPARGYALSPLSGYDLDAPAPALPDVQSSEAEFRKPFAGLNSYARLIQSARPERGAGADVVVTTDWKLKTVPPTIQPLIEELAATGRSVSVMSLSKDHPDLLPLQALDGVTLIDPDTLYTRVPYLSGTSRKRAARYLGAQARPVLRDLPPSVAVAADKALAMLVRAHLPTLMAVQAYARFVFGRPGRRISLACPGRQWHADITHAEAERSKGGFSMTLQNAYMARGYTYTEPRGQYLSAMDAWSADVFKESYGVDPDKIDIVSTPRFDYLVGLKGRDPIKAKAALGFDPERDVVMFASQFGPEVENQAVAEVFAELSTDPDVDAQFVIKTHPKRPLSRIREFLAWAGAVRADHKVQVQRSGDIADFLTASDLALTVFSNVGVEAAVSDTPIIVVHMTDRELPVPLDDFGVGSTARTKEQLRDYILRSLRDPEFQAREAAMRAQFRVDNPAMADGSSARRLMDVMDAHLSGTEPGAVRAAE